MGLNKLAKRFEAALWPRLVRRFIVGRGVVRERFAART
jgi:hypothetical protein